MSAEYVGGPWQRPSPWSGSTAAPWQSPLSISEDAPIARSKPEDPQRDEGTWSGNGRAAEPTG